MNRESKLQQLYLQKLSKNRPITSIYGVTAKPFVDDPRMTKHTDFKLNYRAFKRISRAILDALVLDYNGTRPAFLARLRHIMKHLRQKDKKTTWETIARRIEPSINYRNDLA